MFQTLSPLDDRYYSKTNKLNKFFSEFTFCKYRIQVEILWLEYVIKNLYFEEAQKISKNDWNFLQTISKNFDKEKFLYFQKIEKKTKHDIKAIEYYIKENLEHTNWEKYQELVHFGITSEDTNNIAYALMLKGATEQIYLPLFADVLQHLVKLANQWRADSMLARTHGQVASPTTVGKEIYNFAYRLYRKFISFRDQEFLAKLNGATGNYQALQIAFPKIDWQQFSKDFLHSLGLKQNIATTQIEPHDSLVEFFQKLHHTHSILIGFSQDLWQYISLDYFILKKDKHQVGSSTMPHKVNPIDFENAEGNFGLSNGILEFFIRKLPISRMQRDLSDSTVLRNIGVALGHSLLAIHSLQQGLFKIDIHPTRLQEDLNNHWQVLGEGVQTLLRKHLIKGGYEKIKNASQEAVNENHYKKWVQNSKISTTDKARMLALTPASYIGIAEQFDTSFILKAVKKYVH